MHPDDMPELNQKLSFPADAMRTGRHGMVSGARDKPNFPASSFVFANTQHLVKSLAVHPSVPKVDYPGLTSHPQYELAKRQMRGFGGIVGFEVEGGRESAWKVINNTRLFSITANLGDVKSTITHPASITHGRLSDEQRAAAGIKEGLIRLAVGLEDAKDLIGGYSKGSEVSCEGAAMKLNTIFLK